MSAAATMRNPFAGSVPVFASLERSLRPAADALKRFKQDVQRASGGLDRFAAGLRDGGASVRSIGRDASGASTSVGRMRQSRAATGVQRVGAAAGRARTLAGKLGAGLGGLLAILLPLLPITDTVTRLMDTFGTVMTLASVVMTSVNLAMRANPIGFLVGILVPVAAWLIEYAMNSEAGQRIMKQVMQQALKGFQSAWKFLQPVMKLIGELVANHFKAYLVVFTTALKIIGDAVHGFSHTRALVTSAVNALRGIASNTIGAVKNAIHPFLSFFTDKIPGFFHHAKDAVGNALHGMGELIKGALTAVIGVVKGPIDGLVAFANWIIDGLNKLSFDFLGKHFGVDIPKIPMLAEGGVVFPGADSAPRIDPLTVLEARRVPAITEAPRQPHRIRDFHEDPGAGPRSTAEDLLFLMAAHA
ncbi:tape-measure protein [Streptomyces sp. NPDC013740]|uniref:tape-measure protein n=1 Tax=Streptomyces sp. NPDC013740 TaxID=3364867 RepID=UPI0036F68C4B